MNKHLTLCFLLALSLAAVAQSPTTIIHLDGVHSLKYSFGEDTAQAHSTLYRFSTLGALPGARVDIGRAAALDSAHRGAVAATLGAESGEPLLHRIQGNASRNREHLTNGAAVLRIPYLSTTVSGGMRHDGTFTDRFEDYAGAYSAALDKQLPYVDLGARGLAEYRFGSLSFVQSQVQVDAAVVSYDHWAATPFYRSPLFTRGWQGVMQGRVACSEQGRIALHLSHDHSDWYSVPDTAREHFTTALHLSYQRRLWRGMQGEIAVQHNSIEPSGLNASLMLTDSVGPQGLVWRMQGGVFVSGALFGELSALLPLPLTTTLRVEAASHYQPSLKPWWFSYLDQRITVAPGDVRTNSLKATLSASRTLGALLLKPSLTTLAAHGVALVKKDSISPTRITISQSADDQILYKAQASLATELSVGWIRWTTQMSSQLRNGAAAESLWIPWMVHTALALGTQGDSLPYGQLRAELNGPVEQVQLEGGAAVLQRQSIPPRAALYIEAALPFYAPLCPDYLKPTLALCAGPFSLDGFSRRVRYHPQGSIRGAMVKVELRGYLKRR